MNIPNMISLSRIPLLFICTALLFIRWQWSATAAFVTFVISAWTDWADGYIARRHKMCSTFGAFIDALTDKIFMLGVMVTMLVMHIIPEWCLFPVLLIVLREFLITGLRAVAAAQNVVIPSQKEGKIKTVLQMVSTAFLLGWYALRYDFAHIVTEDQAYWAYVIGLCSFIGATYLTISSGVIYINRFRACLKGM